MEPAPASVHAVEGRAGARPRVDVYGGADRSRTHRQFRRSRLVRMR